MIANNKITVFILLINLSIELKKSAFTLTM